MRDVNILIAAGGTGGHVYPAIAIADALKEQAPGTDILFVGTKNHMEWQAVPKAGYNIRNIWISGFHRQLTLKNLLFPVKLITSLVQSLNILNVFQPNVVVSCGGYVAGPVGWVAAKKQIPLVIQEQNGYPGVTNRLLAGYAQRIFTAFKAADDHFPADKTRLTGNPTRDHLVVADKEAGLKTFNFSEKKPVLLVMGGSGGAKSINEAVQRNLDTICRDKQIQVIWQCGSRYFDRLSSTIDVTSYPNLRLTAFIDHMAEAYAAADLVVSRSGASSCSEFMLTGTACVLIPSPNVAGDHQTENARAMEVQGAAVLLPDHEIRNKLVGVVTELINDNKKLESIRKAARSLARPEAATTIATEILTIARERLN